MPLFRKAAELNKAKKSRALRLFFVSDIHGSEVCFRKFLAAAKVYEPDVLLLGGDFAGKAIVPVLRRGDTWSTLFNDVETTVPLDDYDQLAADITRRGFYPVQMDDEEYARLSGDPQALEELFRTEIAAQAQRWCDLAAERLDPTVRIIITPGNDDPWEADSVFDGSDRVEFPSLATCEVGPFTMASVGIVPTTPWNTERECSEEELAGRIEGLLEPLPGRHQADHELPLPAVRVHAGRRARTRRHAEAGDPRRPAEHRAGRQPRGAGRDQEVPAGRRAARAHPRIARRPKDRPDSMHQSGQRLLFRRIAGCGR